ncbi:MAG: hypothetical protein PHD21_01335 [Flavobacteriales bacterium]|nr:hypothetical protein [Flavobacteriales bacterium]
MAVTFKACVKKDKKVSYLPTEYYAERWQSVKVTVPFPLKWIISLLVLSSFCPDIFLKIE